MTAISANRQHPAGRWQRLLCALCGLILVPRLAGAVGLGELSLHSHLNQPLDATIQLQLEPSVALSELRPAVASAESYRRLAIPYASLFGALRVTAERKADGTARLRLRSKEPVREPLLELVLELSWARGRLQRVYPLLLAPPPLSQAETKAREAAPAPIAEPETVAAPRTAPVMSTPREVEVRPGDTLGEIASAHRPAGMSQAQMLVALFQANPQAFDGGNMNNLRVGARLTLPGPEQQVLSRARAAAMVRRQYREWHGVEPERSKLPPRPRLSAREQQAPAEKVERLQLLAAQPIPERLSSGELGRQLKALREGSALLEEENAVLRERLARLEEQTMAMVEQVLALPVKEDQAAPKHRAAKREKPRQAPVTVSAEAPAAAEEARWWQDPGRWVLILGSVLGLSLLVIGFLLWRRYRRWEYRDFLEALEQE